MSLGAFRRLFFALLALALAFSAVVAGVGIWGPERVSAAPLIHALSVSADRPLSEIGDTLNVTVSGQMSTSLLGDKLVVRVKGPAGPAQIKAGVFDLPEVGKVVLTLGQTVGPAGGPESTSTTTLPPGGSSQADLESGRLQLDVPLPADTPARAGAYLVVAEVKAGDRVVAGGQVWVGKVAARTTPLDLAFVWPVSLGIHRDPAGVFYDSALEQAVLPTGDGENRLASLPVACQHFSGWNLTVAVEPALLTQLRDMADGYASLDASGKQVQVRQDDPRAQNADAVLGALRALASLSSVEVAVSPYSGADLGALGAQGWRDGFEQIQMGKQEVAQTLGLGQALVGAFSPDLSLTSAGLASYAQASIDHVVVSDSVAKLLTEPVDAGTVAVRARDVENDRVTLVVASSGVSSVMAASWDPGALFAAIAAELASTPRDALVITPGVQFTIPPQAYLESIGETLAGLDWVRTQTLSGLLRAHSPGTRPVMLNASPGAPQGYIESALLDSLRAAHAAVTDLAAVADPTRAQVDAAHRLLYMAESRWWWRPQTTPQEATVGLRYALQAQQLAAGELSKVAFAGVSSGTLTGGSGTVMLTLENQTGYPVTVTLRLAGTGLSLADGDTRKVELQPGRTQVAVKVAKADGPHRLDAQLVAGASILDEVSRPLRFITFRTLLPAVVAGGALVLVGLYFLARKLLRRWIPALRRRRPALRRAGKRSGTPAAQAASAGTSPPGFPAGSSPSGSPAVPGQAPDPPPPAG